MSKTKNYLSATEFDLMFDDELDNYYDDEYYYQKYLEDKMILEYQQNLLILQKKQTHYGIYLQIETCNDL